MIPTIRVAEIQSAVVSRYGVTIPEMIGLDRHSRVARPRSIAMHLCRTLTARSLPDIGRRFGGRHHATVIVITAHVRQRMQRNQAFCAEVNSLEAFLLGRVAHANFARLDPATASIRLMEAS